MAVVIRGPQTSRHKGESGDERDLDPDWRADGVEQGGGECEAYESAGEAQHAAAKGGGEIGF